MERINYSIENHGDSVVFLIEGEIDHTNSSSICDVVLSWIDQGKQVAIHMGKLDYIDSSGIACLLHALQRAQTREQGFELIAPSEPVMRVLRLARIDSLFTVHDSIEASTQSEKP